MNELMLNDGKMSSMTIAQITGKTHAHIMRDIRNMEVAWEKISQSKFGFTSYTDQQGKQRPCYLLTKTETLYIATKFDDESRAKLVLRWQELEMANQQQVPTSFRQALLLAAQQQEELEKKNLLIEQKNECISEQAHKIQELEGRTQYLDVIMSSKTSLNIGQIAQDYGKSSVWMNKKLAEMGIQYKQNNQWIIKAPYKAEGYVTSITHDVGNGMIVMHTRWTQKGRLFLYNKLKKQGFIPLIEQNN